MDRSGSMKPMTIGDIMDNTFYLYRDHFLVFFGTAAIIFLPLTLAVDWFSGLIGAGLAELPEEVPFTMTFLAQGFLGLAGILVLSILITPLEGALVKAAADAALGVQPTIASSIKAALARYIPTLAATTLIFSAVLVGLVFLVVPGVLFILWFSVGFQVVLLEKVGPVAAAARSRRLTKGALGRIFLLLAAFGLLVGAIQYALNVPILALLTVNLPDGGPLVALVRVLQGLITALLAPLFLIATTLLYLDLRFRREGLDIELTAARLERALEGPEHVQ